MRCPVCETETPTAQRESAMVRSNVRRFKDEQFEMWRCAQCRSIHAAEDVDLARYYAGYPIFSAELGWMLRMAYGKLLERLTRSGLRRGASVLDYGCGSGAFVKYLQAHGFPSAVGWDAYAEAYEKPELLEATYDCVVSQDVIEHVDDPREFLQTVDTLTVPGGLVSIGTPDAAALDLGNAEDFVHALHAPFHRHILSSTALRERGEAMGWRVARYYPTMYNNTLVPAVNPRFVLHYLRAHDDCFDLVTEPVRLGSLRMWSPMTAFYALFGYFFDRHTDIQFVFEKPA